MVTSLTTYIDFTAHLASSNWMTYRQATKITLILLPLLWHKLIDDLRAGEYLIIGFEGIELLGSNLIGEVSNGFGI